MKIYAIAFAISILIHLAVLPVFNQIDMTQTYHRTYNKIHLQLYELHTETNPCPYFGIPIPIDSIRQKQIDDSLDRLDPNWREKLNHIIID